MSPGKFLLPLLLPVLIAAPVQAATPFASANADRQAKQAVPPAGRALVYLYRAKDSGPAHSPTLQIGNRPLSGLAQETYYYWSVSPGRLSIRSGEATPFLVNISSGRIYFVRLSVSADNDSRMEQVSYGTGRRDLYRARLVRESAPAPVATAPGPKTKPKTETRQKPVSAETARSSFNLIFKGGSFSLGSTDQNIEADAAGTVVPFRTSFSQSAPVFGLEGEWFGESGWAFGGEVLTHSHNYTTVPTGALGTGDMQVVTVAANAKKYFRPESVVQPFLGAGLGIASVTLSGQLEGSSIGYVVQAMGGVAFRWEHVGLYTELKYQLAETADVSVSGPGFFAGFGVHF